MAKVRMGQAPEAPFRYPPANWECLKIACGTLRQEPYTQPSAYCSDGIIVAADIHHLMKAMADESLQLYLQVIH